LLRNGSLLGLAAVLVAFFFTGCGRPHNDTIIYNGVSPSITSISPSSGSITGGTSVTITGSNLYGPGPNTTVAVGGQNATVTNTTAQTITVTTPAGTAGAQNVTVTNGLGTTTIPGGFTYVAPAP
jgi:hypothetical protein